MRRTALSANVTVNADSAGTEELPIVCAVSSAAATWPPITRPDHADDGVHPARDAHLVCIHVVRDQSRHRRERGADADAEQRAGDEDVQRLAMRNGKEQRRNTDDQHPAGQRPLRADSAARSSRPDEPAKSIAIELGKEVQAGLSSRSRRSRSRALTMSRRRCGHEHEAAEAARSPEISVAMFVSKTGRCASIRMSTIGELERSSIDAPEQEEQRRDDDQPEQAR